MIKQLSLLLREYIAQQLILLAIRIAPKEFAFKIGVAICDLYKSEGYK